MVIRNNNCSEKKKRKEKKNTCSKSHSFYFWDVVRTAATRTKCVQYAHKWDILQVIASISTPVVAPIHSRCDTSSAAQRIVGRNSQNPCWLAYCVLRNATGWGTTSGYFWHTAFSILRMDMYLCTYLLGSQGHCSLRLSMLPIHV